MSSVESHGMYYLAPFVKQPDVVPLPKSMYFLPPIVIRKVSCRKEPHLDAEAWVANETSDGSRDARETTKLQLSARQEALLNRLQGLQLQLDQLKSQQPHCGVQHNNVGPSLQSASQFQSSSCPLTPSPLHGLSRPVLFMPSHAQSSSCPLTPSPLHALTRPVLFMPSHAQSSSCPHTPSPFDALSRSVLLMPSHAQSF
ncbi:hypothetical protein FHG87_006009 [Trinorchestia longiramus]|nr:hypothetical protein FHG87_006009 [Trinorchestia longiramus]